MRQNIQNKCQLITYPDSLGGDLANLHFVMNGFLRECFGGVHILHFYPSSADRGFAPPTHLEVDEKFGTWRDLELIREDYDLMADFVINHISRQSKEFQDFQANGAQSPYKDLFYSKNRLLQEGATEETFDLIYRRKPREPFVEIFFSDGSKDKVWCTFDNEQIDINLFSETGKQYFRDSLLRLARRPPNILRIDAFGYAVKKLGTNCFCVEPGTSELLSEVSDIVSAFGVEILPEIHEHHSVALRLAEMGYWTYDFCLPMLVLNAVYSYSAKYLKDWLAICPRKQFTTLDTHDGLPYLDVRGLIPEDELEQTAEKLYSYGANVNKRYSVDPEFDNLGVYQINCTYYSALNNHDELYLIARAIQFFTPGIPQIYYVGMLAGENDIALAERTKVGRNINRQSFSVDEIQKRVQRPVVQELIKLVRFRNSYPAFSGDFTILQGTTDNLLEIAWKADKSTTKLVVMFDTVNKCISATIEYYDLTLSKKSTFASYSASNLS